MKGKKNQKQAVIGFVILDYIIQNEQKKQDDYTDEGDNQRLTKFF